ncbi:endonuclease/exonuclease/phosphatase family protein [Candidatus Saccharibacteria bacterium]|nr:endonuclease/exonuclease/phosphatase family protein [Candidatus Saccharibacteria bacterium]
MPAKHHYTLLSYNLWEDRATHELSELSRRYTPDILCLQESNTAILPSEINELRLADSTKMNRLGLAIYYNPYNLHLEDICSFALNKSLHDHFLSPAHERLLAAKFSDPHTKQTFVAASFHASPLSARNGVRRKQIDAAHAILNTFGANDNKKQSASIMAGDYNYPLFQKKLTKNLEKNGYVLSRSDSHTYARWLKGHYDFVTSSNITIAPVKTLPRGVSDHLPILAKFSLSNEQPNQ